jgi:cytoskeletal protein CcmA (bactofilin family)
MATAQPEACVIGATTAVNGRLSGDQPVTVFGRVEGAIQLANHLHVAEGGQVIAEIEAKTLTVRGALSGDVVAHELVTLQAGSVVTGNIRAPRIVIEEGARFKGQIDMDLGNQG